MLTSIIKATPLSSLTFVYETKIYTLLKSIYNLLIKKKFEIKVNFHLEEYRRKEKNINFLATDIDNIQMT